MIGASHQARSASMALALCRYWSRLILARTAFVLESLSLALLLLLFLTFLVVRADWLATLHEWALFLAHYAQAPSGARAPVDRVLGCAVLLTFLLVAWTKFAAARMTWSALDGAARAELQRATVEIRGRFDPASPL